RRVDLFRDVPAILDCARELHLLQTVTHADSSRLAIGLGARLRVAQLAKFRAAPEIPSFFCHEVDAGGVCEAGHRSGVLVTFLEVNAGAVGKPSLHTRNQVAAADLQTIVRPLVFQRIVQVKIGELGIEEARTELYGGPKVSIGSFTVDPEAFRQAIGAAR